MHNDRLIFFVTSCFEYFQVDVTTGGLCRYCALSLECAIENRVIGSGGELELEHFLEYLLLYLLHLFVGQHFILVHDFVLACARDTIMVLQISYCFTKLLKQIIALFVLL